MTEIISPRTHRRHYTTGLIVLLAVMFAGLYFLIKPLSVLDESIVTNLRLMVPGLFTLMVTVSAVCAPLPMVVLALAWSGVEFAWGRRDRAYVMTASLLSAPVFFVLKELVHRSRPASQYVEQLNLHSYSFPSGHATMSFTILLTLAYLLSLRLSKLVSRVVTTLLVLLVLLVGISRVYLQVHYPTDILGGWIIGAIVLLAVRAYASSYELRTGRQIKA